jgi:uncharacterized membrane-anchored protein YhcB (DUF1043 family)
MGLGLWDMIVVVTVIGCITGVITTYIEGKAKHAAKGKKFSDLQAQLEAYQAEVQGLRDRVGVLEKLATDDDRRLAGEIDRLRGDARVGV